MIAHLFIFKALVWVFFSKKENTKQKLRKKIQKWTILNMKKV